MNTGCELLTLLARRKFDGTSAFDSFTGLHVRAKLMRAAAAL